MGYRKKIDKGLKRALSGDWKLIDSRSGFVIHASEAVFGHNGEITSQENFDEPQADYFPVTVPTDNQLLPIVSSEPADYEPATWITENDL